MFDHSHDPEQVARRIAELRQPSYIGDAVLGAIDGGITTVAIVAGAMGAGLSSAIILALGTANVIADGLSMAVGNYQRARSDQQFARRARAEEHRHIREHPEGEREEVRQILMNQGFEAPLLEQAIDVITSDRKRWVDLMISEEWGIAKSQQNPRRVGWVTFAAFVAAGIIPLLPFVAFGADTTSAIWLTVIVTAAVFAGIGAWRARLFGERMLTGGFETLLTGGGAAFVAFFVAHYLHRWISV